ncbi:MAG: hypothetical protein B7X95_07915 [Methylophilaceae bacterium 17-44-8]|nr:MAG: hypothetical protein B7X95_07915 [Methylophilaceae bacterium 17-44-8]
MKKSFYIDYPQEHMEGQAHRYRCVFCKQETTSINGNLEGHTPNCEYRIQMEKAGFECLSAHPSATIKDADDYD